MRKDKNNLVAYGILTCACLVVALIFGAFPELFAHGPPSWRLFLSGIQSKEAGVVSFISEKELNSADAA